MERLWRVAELSRTNLAGDFRADFLEPMLGNTLQDLERCYQRGEGCSTGLVAIFEVRKDGSPLR